MAGLTACAAPIAAPDTHAAPPIADWVSERQRDHPLAGRIWDVSAGTFTDPETMMASLGRRSFVLLGEKHDNEDHHRLQRWVLDRLLSAGRRPAVAFEMFTSDQDKALAAFLAEGRTDARGLGNAVGWSRTGWPRWELYQPLAQAALDARLPILSANLPRSQIRKLARNGVGILGDQKIRELRLGRDMPEAELGRMRRQITVSHCNQLPDSMVGPLATVLRVRDAHMASVLERGRRRPGADGAVLIAGAGHVRTDHGVAWHLKDRDPAAGVSALALLEVSKGQVDPVAYASRFQADRLPFDYVWFTPRTDAADACEKFASQLKHARQRHLRDRRR